MNLSFDTLETLEKYIEIRYKTKVFTYSTSTGKHREILDLLKKIKVKNSVDFVQNYVLTYEHNIYLPYPVGVEYINTIDQLSLLVHGLQHIVQEDKDGRFYMHTYLADLKKRTEWEVGAILAEICLRSSCEFEIPTKKEVYQELKVKGCPKTEIDKYLNNWSTILSDIKNKNIKNDLVDELLDLI